MGLFSSKRVEIEKLLPADRLADKIFRPYYLNAEKIDQYFVSYIGDLTSYSVTNEKELRGLLGITAKWKLGEILTALAAEAKMEGSMAVSRSQSFAFDVGSFTRFIILRSLWRSRGSTRKLHEAVRDGKSNQLVETESGFHFYQHVEEGAAQLSIPQIAEINDQKSFESETGEEKHLLVFATDPTAVALVSRKWVTNSGKRNLKSGWVQQAGVFSGAIIDGRAGVVFLDPLAAGALADA